MTRILRARAAANRASEEYDPTVRRPQRVGFVLSSGLLVIVAAGIVIALSDSGSPERPPAEQVAGFSAAPTPATLPDAAARQQFIRAWSNPGLHGGPPMVKSLDLRHLRRFSLGDPSGFSVVAARSKTGGICFIGSVGGGGCIDSFDNGAGMAEGSRKVGPAMHNVITGFVPDGVSEISFATNAGSFSAPVRNNVFRFVVPTQGPVVYAYTLVRADGSKRVEPFGTLARQP
jgi:hypothetical protein